MPLELLDKWMAQVRTLIFCDTRALVQRYTHP